MTIDLVKKTILNLKSKMFGITTTRYAVKSNEIIMQRLLRWLGLSQHSLDTIEADVFRQEEVNSTTTSIL